MHPQSFELIEKHHKEKFTLATVPREDGPTYDMLCRADSLGVFQVESRAQMNMLPRLKPRIFYDLVIEVAIVRPGPIQGDMVHPYLRRRAGTRRWPIPIQKGATRMSSRLSLEKPWVFRSFRSRPMRLAMVAAEFTDEEVSDLRRAMATFRRVGTIGLLEDKMVSQMVARGYDKDFATRCFSQIKGFGEYGFPESHAASFALLVYISSWIKCHYPEVFACALLNSQPMGFYAPAQIVRDAAQHEVDVRDADVSFSAWHSTLEDKAGEPPALSVSACGRLTASRKMISRGCRVHSEFPLPASGERVRPNRRTRSRPSPRPSPHAKRRRMGRGRIWALLPSLRYGEDYVFRCSKSLRRPMHSGRWVSTGGRRYGK